MKVAVYTITLPQNHLVRTIALTLHTKFGFRKSGAEINCKHSVIISVLLFYILVETALIEQFQYQVI